jgi:diguanylate cyclase (GGDEF)-like protein
MNIMDKNCENCMEKCRFVFSNIKQILDKFLKTANFSSLEKINDIITNPESSSEKFKDVTEDFFNEVEFQILKCQESDKKRVKKTIKLLQDDSDVMIEQICSINETSRKTVEEINNAASFSDLEKSKKNINSAIKEFLNFSENIKEKIENIKSKLSIKLTEIINLENEIEHIKQKIYIDELTGLLNKKGIKEVYNSLLRNESAVHENCIMFLDIDKFKNINDTYGHVAGDLIIKLLSKILKESLRDNDIISRIYGDEFLIILKKTDLEIAKSIAERLRKHIEKAIFYYKKEPIKITISGGLSKIDRWKSFDEAVEEVDKLMYTAKQQGNKIIYF